MSRLPTPGSDNNTWGDILNDFLAVAHNSDGTLKGSGVAAAGAEQTSNKGVNNGYASLDSSGKVPTSQLPPSAGGVQSVTATDSTVVVGGTATDPTVGVGTIPESKVTNLISDLAAKVPATRNITAGTGLSGGGDLTADRTLSVSFGAIAGTAAQGNDSRITGAIQASTVTTKGDILAATGASTVARLGAGSNGQVLTADSTQTSGVKWATPASDNTLPYPLSEYGLISGPGDPLMFGGVSAIGTGTTFYLRLFVPANTTISAVKFVVQTAGTYSSSATPNQLAVYDDNGNRLGITADDSTMWSTVGWYSANLPSTIAAQGSSRFVYAAFICGGYTGVSPAFIGGISSGQSLISQLVNGNVNGKSRAMFVNGQSSLAASFDPTTFGTATQYVPFIGLVA